MTNYELLLNQAYNIGLNVKEKPLHSSNGRIKGKRIAIRKNIETSNEKACVLAEELGHYYTTVGNIIDLSDTQNRKQERQARLWGYNNRIGLYGLIRAYEHGCNDGHEIADFLEVTEEYLNEAVNCYREKYGTYKTVDNYIVYFIPQLAIGKRM